MSGARDQDSWRSRTREDLLQEAHALTEQFKATHDDSLVPRIQTLRRAAYERRSITGSPDEKQRDVLERTRARLNTYSLGFLVKRFWQLVFLFVGGLLLYALIWAQFHPGDTDTAPRPVTPSQARLAFADTVADSLAKLGMSCVNVRSEGLYSEPELRSSRAGDGDYQLTIKGPGVDESFAQEWVQRVIDSSEANLLQDMGFTQIGFIQDDCHGSEPPGAYHGTYDLRVRQFD
jgi:hypothetical protein